MDERFKMIGLTIVEGILLPVVFQLLHHNSQFQLVHCSYLNFIKEIQTAPLSHRSYNIFYHGLEQLFINLINKNSLFRKFIKLRNHLKKCKTCNKYKH